MSAWLMQDELIERLGGVDAVAEMSGRKRRMVKQPNGTYKYCLRSSAEGGLDRVCHCLNERLLCILGIVPGIANV